MNKGNRRWQKWIVAFLCCLATTILITKHRSDGDGDPAYAQTGDETPGPELDTNSGFEEGGSPPRGWSRDMQKTRDKGSVTQDTSRFHGGKASVKLQPNNKNGADSPLAISQLIPAGEYRGKRVRFSGYLVAEGGTQAILGMLAIVRGAPHNLQMLFQKGSDSPDWTLHEQTYPVPEDPSVQLALICMTDGKSGAAWFDDVSVVPLMPGRARAAPSRFPEQRATAKPATRVDVDAAHVIRDIPRTLYGANIEWRWNATYLWDEKSRRADPEAMRLTRELGVSVIRYPGGIYSDFYHWKDGTGPYERRPIVKHEPGKQDRSRPNFGTDEVLEFAKQVGAEVWITVNVGTGTAQEAAEWVRYVNGSRRRVRFWEIGNEIYINDGSAVTKAVTMDANTYADKVIEYAKAMRSVDSGIKIAAVGGENQGRYAIVSYPDWNRTVLQKAGNFIDLMSVHNGYAPLVLEENESVESVYKAMFAAPINFARNLDVIGRRMQEYAPGIGSKIGIAVTEWGPAFKFDLNSRWVDHVKTLGAALYSASALKTMIESPRVEAANFWMLNDFSALGVLGSRNTEFPAKPEWTPTPRYYVFQLFTKHFGERLIETRTTGSPVFDSTALGVVDPVRNAPYLDVVSSINADGSKLYIVAINKHFEDPIEVSFSLRGFSPQSEGTAWTLTGAGVDAHTGTGIIKVPGLRIPKQAEYSRNGRFHKGSEREVVFQHSIAADLGDRFTYTFQPHSATSLVLTRRGQ